MFNVRLTAGASALVLAMVCAQQAAAQEPAEVDELVVTGSLIAGTPEDAALPVDVIGGDTLAKQGSPSMLEIVKQLPVSGAVLGDSNQFPALSAGAQGVGSINLRGLGFQRTLVLLNGRRSVPSPANAAQVDTNLMPIAAVGRVEVLKGGGSTVYGSDAMAGVVNFITRAGFDGLEVDASYRYIRGADQPDYSASVLWGWAGDNANALLAVGFQQRGQLSATKRDFSVNGYLELPQAWSSLGNPATYQARAGATAVVPAGLAGAPASGMVRERNCTAVGGFAGVLSNGNPACLWTYTPRQNLIEQTKQYQLYGEVNVQLTDDIDWHFEALYANTLNPDYRNSPSYGPSFGINGPAAPLFVIPASNPGAANFLATHGYSAAQIATITEVNPVSGLWRPLAIGGNPLFDGRGGTKTRRETDIYRFSTNLKGDLTENLGFDVGATYGHARYMDRTPDILVSKMDRALRGFGGPSCTSTNAADAGNAAANCYYFNPFSSRWKVDPATGAVNPDYVAALENREDVVRNLFGERRINQEGTLFVVDGTLSGAIPFELPGGAPKWAAGYQYRWSKVRSIWDVNSDVRITPCTQPGVTNCALKTGPWMFLGVYTPTDVDQKTHSFFGELNLPLLDNVNAQVALRHESYGDESTTNPKIAAKWEVNDFISVRASYGTTFRNPPAFQLSATSGSISLPQITVANSQARTVETVGNPNLKPEKGEDYNIGFLVDWRGVRASVDYWSYKIEDQITAVPANAIANAVVVGGLANCSSPFANLIIFTSACQQGVTTGSDISRLNTQFVNGPTVKTRGIDFNVDFQFDDVLGGDIGLGASATYILEYKQGEFFFNGSRVSAAIDAVGYANYDRGPTQVPKWRANFYAEYHRGIHNLRLTADYDGKLIDERASLFTLAGGPNANPGGGYVFNAANQVQILKGQVVKPSIVFDLHYQVQLPWDTVVTASVLNLFDKDPPFARLPYGYDPFVASAVGRSFELGVRKRF